MRALLVLLVQLTWLWLAAHVEAGAVTQADAWGRAYQAGREAYDADDYEIARDRWLSALTEAEKFGRRPELEMTLESLGWVSDRLGNTDDAIDYSERLVSLLRTKDRALLELAEAFGTLARRYEHAQRFDDALHALVEARDIVSGVFSDYSILPASVDLDIARHYRVRGNLEQSVSEYQEILKKLNGSDPSGITVQALEEYSETLDLAGRHEEARAARSQADAVRAAVNIRPLSSQ